MPREVTAVEPAGEHRLLLTFRGGEQRIIDLAGLIQFTGVFLPLRDRDYFEQVRVNADLGTIVWPNGADLCPDVLYAESRTAGEDAA